MSASCDSLVGRREEGNVRSGASERKINEYEGGWP